MIQAIQGGSNEKATRVNDLLYYQRLYFEDRLHADAHERNKQALEQWRQNGQPRNAKPEWLSILSTVTKEHWQRETEEFRAAMHTANEEDFRAREAAAKEANEAAARVAAPTTPQEYDRYVPTRPYCAARAYVS